MHENSEITENKNYATKRIVAHFLIHKGQFCVFTPHVMLMLYTLPLNILMIDT